MATNVFLGRSSAGRWVNLLCDKNGATAEPKQSNSNSITTKAERQPCYARATGQSPMRTPRAPEAAKSLAVRSIQLCSSASNASRPTPDQKPKCSVCNQSFTHSGHRARHMRIHTGSKPYKCLLNQCCSTFSRKDNMMQHYRARHCWNYERNDNEQTGHRKSMGPHRQSPAGDL
ncbi:hypothetical protein DFJ77DRAFT_134096 [Powellomyces hirtus]|nr:hypothetical protein DFJ77DRAFT_134096 [Powellomyces hirtus]